MKEAKKQKKLSSVIIPIVAGVLFIAIVLLVLLFSGTFDSAEKGEQSGKSIETIALKHTNDEDLLTFLRGVTDTYGGTSPENYEGNYPTSFTKTEADFFQSTTVNADDGSVEIEGMKTELYDLDTSSYHPDMCWYYYEKDINKLTLLVRASNGYDRHTYIAFYDTSSGKPEFITQYFQTGSPINEYYYDGCVFVLTDFYYSKVELQDEYSSSGVSLPLINDNEVDYSNIFCFNESDRSIGEIIGVYNTKDNQFLDYKVVYGQPDFIDQMGNMLYLADKVGDKSTCMLSFKFDGEKLVPLKKGEINAVFDATDYKKDGKAVTFKAVNSDGIELYYRFE